METQLDFAGLSIDVVFKDIKNIHLSVNPPNGRVRITAPMRMKLDNVRVFAISKLAWIKSQQQKIISQPREAPREFLELESHYLWGHRYLLKIEEVDRPPSVRVRPGKLFLTVRPGTNETRMADQLSDYYRSEIRRELRGFLDKWIPILGVEVNQVYVQHMKTKWGSCNHHARNIRINTELAKKPKECLEYIIVHELIHLLEPTHNERFQHLLNVYLPSWPQSRNLLNQLPVRHEDWIY